MLLASKYIGTVIEYVFLSTKQGHNFNIFMAWIYQKEKRFSKSETYNCVVSRVSNVVA